MAPQMRRICAALFSSFFLIACSQAGTNGPKTCGTGDKATGRAPYSRRISRAPAGGFRSSCKAFRRKHIETATGAARWAYKKRPAACLRQTYSRKGACWSRTQTSQAAHTPTNIRAKMRQIRRSKRHFKAHKRHRADKAQTPAIVHSAPRSCGRVSHPHFTLLQWPLG